MEIITGYTGKDHVTAADDASLYRAIFGSGDYVLNVGSVLKHTVISNNLIKIADGDVMIQGHQGRTKANDYTEVTIDNGTAGMKRHDLIVARYEKNVETGIESINLVVMKGIAATTAVDPEIIQENISTGGTRRDFPLYRVKLNGINIELVEQLFVIPRVIWAAEVEEF